MAEPLKNRFGPQIPVKIAEMIRASHPRFPAEPFIAHAVDGYEPLNLLQRGWKIARALRVYLPDDAGKAMEILIASLGPKLTATQGNGMSPFLLLPYSCFVAEYGLGHFEVAMRAQYEVTQRFTAEFSIRPYLVHHRDATLARLRQWTSDESEHVRRLVSEGTRPRLPWASRLREFQKNPAPVLELLELLKDDRSLYVRRSVANNLNDIGKDHPALLTETANRWMKDASDERRWIIGHALRTAIKRGEPGALKAMGFGKRAELTIQNASVLPARAAIGDRVVIAFDVCNPTRHRQRVLIDFRVHFVKSNGKTSPKVFKLKAVDLAAGGSATLKKTVSLAPMTTRKTYPGVHKIDVLLNGVDKPLGKFELIASPAQSRKTRG